MVDDGYNCFVASLSDATTLTLLPLKNLTPHQNFSLALINAVPSLGNLGYLLALGASFGRMYFFAHHIFDVTVGCLIAVMCTVALERLGRAHEFQFGLGQAVAGMVLFIGCYKQLLKVRKAVPRQFKSKSGGWIDNDP